MTQYLKKTEGGSYRSILKSTSIIGGSSVINLLILMVRTKFVAILLGPSGIGLLGMYSQLIALIGNVTRLGIGNSGVRQIAEAVGTNDSIRIARTVTTVRRTTWLMGILGLLTMALFCVPLSYLTFESNRYSWAIAVLGISLFAAALTCGQQCIINGTRRIGDLAKMSILGAISGTLISIPCYYFWGHEGIVPSLIISSLATLATSWWFARRVAVEKISLSLRASYSEMRSLLSLGGIIMCAGLMGDLSNYLLRIMLLRQFSLSDLGIYQAAFTLSGILVGFVLSAISLDYYPRLTAVVSDNGKANRLVNDQTQIAILLSLPFLAAMIIFAPLIIKILYNESFVRAIPILRWCTIGMLARIVSVALSYWILAKGKGKLFFAAEAIVGGLHLAGVYIFSNLWGLNGAGIAFTVAYTVYTVFLLMIMHRMVGSSWSKQTLVQAITALLVLVLLMLNGLLNTSLTMSWFLDLVVLAVVTFLCVRHLSKKSGINIHTLQSRFRGTSN